MKKIISMILLSIGICALGFNVSSVTTAEAVRKALFIKTVGIVKESASSTNEIYINFNKEVATAEKEITTEKDMIYLDNVSVKDLSKKNSAITMKYKKIASVDADDYLLVISVPTSETSIKFDGNNKIKIKGGFTGGTSNLIITTDLVYNLGTANNKDAKRVYRLDESEYEGVELLSMGAPVKPSKSNMIIKFYLSSEICSRKLVNLEFWYERLFIGLMLPDYPYTTTEVTNLFNYGIVGKLQPTSLLYKIKVGSTKFNGLTYYNSKQMIDTSEKIENFDMYTVEALMRSTDVYGGAVADMSQLAMQIHAEGSTIEFAFKGDAPDDRYNLAPEVTDDIIIKLEKGLMFPNGKMLKADVIYRWNPDIKQWKNITNGSGDGDSFVDETLENQGGYTDDELKASSKK